MNREDVIRMAREAGCVNCDCCLPELEPDEMQEFIERFAALVAAHEREECAKVADRQNGDDEEDPESCVWSKAARHIAAAIRARGEKCI